MKVEVATVEDAKFRKWSWWSDWIDISIFDYGCMPYLVQMSVSRRNKKRFRSVCLTGWKYRQSHCVDIGNLTQMKGKEK